MRAASDAFRAASSSAARCDSWTRPSSDFRPSRSLAARAASSRAAFSCCSSSASCLLAPASATCSARRFSSSSATRATAACRRVSRSADCASSSCTRACSASRALASAASAPLLFLPCASSASATRTASARIFSISALSDVLVGLGLRLDGLQLRRQLLRLRVGAACVLAAAPAIRARSCSAASARTIASACALRLGRQLRRADPRAPSGASAARRAARLPRRGGAHRARRSAPRARRRRASAAR